MSAAVPSYGTVEQGEQAKLGLEVAAGWEEAQRGRGGLNGGAEISACVPREGRSEILGGDRGEALRALGKEDLGCGAAAAARGEQGTGDGARLRGLTCEARLAGGGGHVRLAAERLTGGPVLSLSREDGARERVLLS